MKWRPSPDFWIAGSLFLLTLLPLLLTAGDIGLTYDEPIYGGEALKLALWVQQSLGDALQGDLRTPFKQETIEAAWTSKDMQPPFAKYLTAGSLLLLSPAIGYLPAVRFASAFLLSLCVATLYLWGTKVWGRRCGLVAAFALLLMPCVWGHAHLTTMDVPVAAMVFLTAFCVWKLSDKKTVGWTLLTGIVAGCALGTKMNALVPFPVFLAWSTISGRRAFLCTAAALLLAAPLVFFANWPWLWLDPATHVRQYLEFQLKHYPIGVSYFGKVYVIPPWHYPWVMTAITTPPMTLLLAVAGAGLCFKQLGDRRRTSLLLLGSCAIQLLAFSMPNVPKYNGSRLFLSIFPFVAMLAGIGFDEVITRCEAAGWYSKLKPLVEGNASRQKQHLIALVGALCLVPGLRSIIIMHPFELSYYNMLIGGLPGAVRHGFESTYWGDSYYQALGFFNAKAPPGSVLNISPAGVVSYFTMYQRSGTLREDLQFSGGDENLTKADFVIFHTRVGEMSPAIKELFKKGKPVYTVACQGVPLAVVYTRSEVLRLHLP
ncbi:MAG: glycosyltransferase family 39 protein [Armatimonadetes bacterium]|nr:glycosyltransferase family 39 protein [Armatimonadota bacterium]